MRRTALMLATAVMAIIVSSRFAAAAPISTTFAIKPDTSLAESAHDYGRDYDYYPRYRPYRHYYDYPRYRNYPFSDFDGYRPRRHYYNYYYRPYRHYYYRRYWY